MNDDTIEDLKQFIASTISQKTAGLREDIVTDLRADIKKLDDNLRADIKRLDDKIDELSASVAEALDTSNETTEARLNDHDKQLNRLEQKAA